MERGRKEVLQTCSMDGSCQSGSPYTHCFDVCEISVTVVLPRSDLLALWLFVVDCGTRVDRTLLSMKTSVRNMNLCKAGSGFRPM